MSSSRAEQKMREQLEDVVNDPPTGVVSVTPIDNNIHEWEVIMNGPQRSYYETGKFKIHISFSNIHPFKPPSILFKTNIFH